MIVRNVRSAVRPGLDFALYKRFRNVYSLAVRLRRGFRGSWSMPVANGQDASEYISSICFDNEGLRLAWPSTAEHEQAWARVRSLCSTVSDEELRVVADI